MIDSVTLLIITSQTSHRLSADMAMLLSQALHCSHDAGLKCSFQIKEAVIKAENEMYIIFIALNT